MFILNNCNVRKGDNVFVLSDLSTNITICLKSIDYLISILNELFTSVFKSPYANRNILENDHYNLLLATIERCNTSNRIVKFYAKVEGAMINIYLLECNNRATSIVYLHTFKKQLFTNYANSMWSMNGLTC